MVVLVTVVHIIVCMFLIAVVLLQSGKCADIAAAFGVPVVVLFGPSNPVTWAPWRTEARVLTSEGSIANISLDEVLSAADALRLAGMRAGARTKA